MSTTGKYRGPGSPFDSQQPAPKKDRLARAREPQPRRKPVAGEQSHTSEQSLAQPSGAPTRRTVGPNDPPRGMQPQPSQSSSIYSEDVVQSHGRNASRSQTLPAAPVAAAVQSPIHRKAINSATQIAAPIARPGELVASRRAASPVESESDAVSQSSAASSIDLQSPTQVKKFVSDYRDATKWARIADIGNGIASPVGMLVTGIGVASIAGGPFGFLGALGIWAALSLASAYTQHNVKNRAAAQFPGGIDTLRAISRKKGPQFKEAAAQAEELVQLHERSGGANVLRSFFAPVRLLFQGGVRAWNYFKEQTKAAQSDDQDGTRSEHASHRDSRRHAARESHTSDVVDRLSRLAESYDEGFIEEDSEQDEQYVQEPIARDRNDRPLPADNEEFERRLAERGYSRGDSAQANSLRRKPMAPSPTPSHSIESEEASFDEGAMLNPLEAAYAVAELQEEQSPQLSPEEAEYQAAKALQRQIHVFQDFGLDEQQSRDIRRATGAKALRNRDLNTGRPRHEVLADLPNESHLSERDPSVARVVFAEPFTPGNATPEQGRAESAVDERAESPLDERAESPVAGASAQGFSAQPMATLSPASNTEHLGPLPLTLQDLMGGAEPASAEEFARMQEQLAQSLSRQVPPSSESERLRREYKESLRGSLMGDEDAAAAVRQMADKVRLRGQSARNVDRGSGLRNLALLSPRGSDEELGTLMPPHATFSKPAAKKPPVRYKPAASPAQESAPVSRIPTPEVQTPVVLESTLPRLRGTEGSMPSRLVKQVFTRDRDTSNVPFGAAFAEMHEKAHRYTRRAASLRPNEVSAVRQVRNNVVDVLATSQIWAEQLEVAFAAFDNKANGTETLRSAALRATLGVIAADMREALAEKGEILVPGKVAGSLSSAQVTQAMLYHVKRVTDGTYDVTLYNAGYGLDTRHVPVQNGADSQFDPAYTTKSVRDVDVHTLMDLLSLGASPGYYGEHETRMSSMLGRVRDAYRSINELNGTVSAVRSNATPVKGDERINNTWTVLDAFVSAQVGRREGTQFRAYTQSRIMSEAQQALDLRSLDGDPVQAAREAGKPRAHIDGVRTVVEANETWKKTHAELVGPGGEFQSARRYARATTVREDKLGNNNG